MIRTQISVDEELYHEAKEVAGRQGISLAELFRRSLREKIDSEPRDAPWMEFAGMLDGDASDSESVDEVVYRREAP